MNKTLGNVFRRHLARADDGFTGGKRELRVVRDGPFSVLLESDRSGLTFKRPAHRITQRASYNATTGTIVQAQYRVIRQWRYGGHGDKQYNRYVMKTIGIVAHSFEGAALCFLTACREGAVHLGPHMHPNIIMSALPMGLCMPAWQANDHAAVGKFLFEGVQQFQLSS